MLTTATLGPVELLTDAPVSWPDVPGVHPAEVEFAVTPADLKTLLELRGPLTLTISPGGDGEKKVVRNLWALRGAPGPSPHQPRVLVMDRRWFWAYPHITRNYNIRRRTGYYRISANDVEELERTEERFNYALFSLIDGERVTPTAAMQSILSELSEFEAENGGAPFLLRPGPLPPETSFEDCNINGDGQVALAQMLAFLPGLDLRINELGDVVLFDRSEDGASERVLAAVLPETVGGGHTMRISHANEAPREIEFLFPIEAELRFDFIERTENDTAPVDPDETLRELKAVIPLPDYQLTVAGSLEVQGTIVGYQDYLSALPALPSGGRLTDKMVRAAFMPFMDLWSSILTVGLVDTDSDWSARVSALQQYYRRMMRLPRGWHDRVLAWRAYRVATVNQATGARAPAMVYADHAILGGQRSQLRNYRDREELVYAINVDGYRETIDAQARPSPASVRLYDADQGVVMWDFHVDPYRVYEAVLPSKIEPETGPAYGVPSGDSRRPITFDSIKQPGSGVPRLAGEHKAALILTATPGAPNNSRQYYSVVVKPDDVFGKVSPLVMESARRARGPRMQIKISQGMETARLRWIDDRSDDFERLFGIQDGTPDLDGLCINASGNGRDIEILGAGAISGASLDEICKARAARIWASYADHPQGTSTGAMANVGIDGWVSSLVSTLYPDGTATTMATFPDRLPQLDMAALLDAGTRAILQREVFRK